MKTWREINYGSIKNFHQFTWNWLYLKADLFAKIIYVQGFSSLNFSQFSVIGFNFIIAKKILLRFYVDDIFFNFNFSSLLSGDSYLFSIINTLARTWSLQDPMFERKCRSSAQNSPIKMVANTGKVSRSTAHRVSISSTKRHFRTTTSCQKTK